MRKTIKEMLPPRFLTFSLISSIFIYHYLSSTANSFFPAAKYKNHYHITFENPSSVDSSSSRRLSSMIIYFVIHGNGVIQTHLQNWIPIQVTYSIISLCLITENDAITVLVFNDSRRAVITVNGGSTG